MKIKTLFILAVVLLMTAIFAGCKTEEPSQAQESSAEKQAAQTEPEDSPAQTDSDKPEGTPIPAANEVHAGLAYSTDGGYESEMAKNGVRTLMAVSSIKITVTEAEAGNDPKQAIDALINQGCEIIFTVGIDEKQILDAAAENPGVNFEIYGRDETGGLHNVSAFYARMYQQQYLNGLIAGYLSETGSIGYLAQTAENTDIRRVNAFALGVKSANSEAVVHFSWTGDGADDGNGKIAGELFEKGCDVIFSTRPGESLKAMADGGEISLICPKSEGTDMTIRMIEPEVFSYAVDKARATAQNRYASNGMIAGWVSISAYEINFDKYPFLTGEQKAMVQEAASKMAKSEWDVFTGPITDKYGQTIIPEGSVIPDEDLLYMLWYVGNIRALPPPMG